MQGNLLNELLKLNNFSVQLTTLLDKISKHFSALVSDSSRVVASRKKNLISSPTIKQLQHHLISLTCQNKNLLHYKYLENKINNEHCIAYIIQILCHLMQLYEQSIDTITSAFITHILSHPSCYISFYTFLMLVQSCPQIITKVPYEKLYELMSKIQKQQNILDDIKMLHSIHIKNEHLLSKQHLQICDRNLSNYLKMKQKPKKFKEHQPSIKKNQKSFQIKIPPLALPTSKSLNSQRYLALSKDQKSKGLGDLQKLASSLGQNFITVELGCLLANKRTRQVQQYSQNETFRQKCIQKIQKIHTQRMNSSRVSLLLQGNLSYGKLSNFQNTSIEPRTQNDENSKRYYEKVLTGCLNILYRKIASQQHKITFLDFIISRVTPQHNFHKKSIIDKETYFINLIELIKQIIDMNVIQGKYLNEGADNIEKKHGNKIQTNRYGNTNVFTLALKSMKSIEQVTKQLMNILSLQTQKLHKYLLMNQNKRNSSFHYDYDHFGEVREDKQFESQCSYVERQDLEIFTDELLGNIQVRVNQAKILDGGFKLFSDRREKQDKLLALKLNSDPVLMYLSNFLQSLLESADMGHPLFYQYQTNTLKSINFYLQSTLPNNRVSIFYVAEFMTPLLILLKRELLELSHPYFNSKPNHSTQLYSLNSLSESSGKKSTSKKHNVSLQSKTPPLIHSHSQLMNQYIKLLTNLLQGNLNLQQEQFQTKRNKYIEKLIANLFVRNIYFMELLENFTEFVFKEQKVNQIIVVMGFYKKALEVYAHGYHSSHRNKGNMANQNKSLKFLYQHLAGYLEPKNGCIAKILNQFQIYISPSQFQDSEFQSESPQSLIQKSKVQMILHQIFVFISTVYYIASPDCSEALVVLEQDIASFYIKYSIMGFIKLYSLLTVTELVNINTGSIKNPHEIDYVLSTKESPHPSTQVNVKQIFMIDFLKILTNLSINRTEQIAKKFRQHRVLEFFAREIELEFSVSENIEKYIQKAKDIEEIKQIHKPVNRISETISDSSSDLQYQQFNALKLPLAVKVQPGKQKKISVPGLNLSGKLFQKGQKSQQFLQQSSKDAKFNKTNVFNNEKPIIEKLALKTEENISHFSSKQSKGDPNPDKNKKKGFLDDMLDEIVKPKKRSDKSVTKKTQKQRRKSTKGTKNFKTQTNTGSLNMDLNLNLQGLKNKTSQNQAIHSETSKTHKESDSSLIYQTQRKIRKIYSNKVLHSQSILLILSLVLYKGQLDPFYCDQMPIIHGKLNVLYLLHYHLNHESNKSILPILAQGVKKIKPYLSGQRLFKLLSNAYTDLSQYYNWTKINSGAFGVVMKALTYLQEPKEVAIKQMNFPKSIYQRCVLHDIFTEIACLQMFRLEEKVTKMYNYGVIDNTYVIIMKKYACSVRDWRLNNVESSQAQLFSPTLPNILALFYEILKGVKLLHDQNVTHYDIKGDNILLDFGECSNTRQSPIPKAVFADFGVCKAFSDEKDELDLKSRGTECIKSPEMLTLTLKNKKQADNYDRRKKIGTTRASDIWSLGCLLYELVTGEFLFNSNDWVHFFMQLTSPTEEIITQAHCQKMNNNIYLIDFLKYILIRDPQHRPSIHSILGRFENLYALLVSNPQRFASTQLRISYRKNLDELVLKYLEDLNGSEKRKKTENSRERQKSKPRAKQPGLIRNKEKKIKKEEELGKTGKVMSYFNPKYSGKMMKIMEDIYFCENQKYLLHYENRIRAQGITHIIVMSGANANTNKFKVLQICLNGQSLDTFMYRLCPKISDFLRQILLVKGKLLFVNNQSNYAANLLIYVLSYWFKCSVYETWCLINTQILLFPALSFNNNLKKMSKMLTILNQIENQIEQYPKLQCICGSVTIIMNKKFQEKKGELRACRCSRKSNDKGQCFSKNCNQYLQFIKKRYNICWDNLTWASINKADLLTPLTQSMSSFESLRASIMLNSAPPSENLLIEQQHKGYEIASCKVCEMWMISSKGEEIWVILNNLIKSYRQGIMIPNAQQQFKARTPALNYFTLSKLHMTSQ